MHVSQLFMSQSSTKFHCGLIFNLQLFMLSWQIQTPIFPCSNEAAGGGVWVLVSESFPLSQWPPKLHQNCGHGGSQGHGQGSQTQRKATTSSIPCIKWEGKEYTYHTNLLIAFCKDNLDFQLKLFSNSTQDTIKQGILGTVVSRWVQTETVTTNTSHNTYLPTTRIP